MEDDGGEGRELKNRVEKYLQKNAKFFKNLQKNGHFLQKIAKIYKFLPFF
jgi:hypothetical protein